MVRLQDSSRLCVSPLEGGIMCAAAVMEGIRTPAATDNAAGVSSRADRWKGLPPSRRRQRGRRGQGNGFNSLRTAGSRIRGCLATRREAVVIAAGACGKRESVGGEKLPFCKGLSALSEGRRASPKDLALCQSQAL